MIKKWLLNYLAIFVLKIIRYLLANLAVIFLFALSTGNALAQAIPDHFEFNTFTSGGAKMAGVPFQVTIYARDSMGLNVVSFNGQANLNDDTGTVYPTVTGNFQSGVWTGDIYITKATNSTHLYVNYNGATGTSNVFTVNPDRRIKFVTIQNGNNQTGPVNTQLANALILKVVDPFNNAISNVGVNFSVTGYPPGASGQQLTSMSAVTNGEGLASTAFVTGRKAGTYVVTATLTDGVTNNTQFFETAVAGPARAVSISPGLAVLPAGSYLPFTAKVFDQFNNEKVQPAVAWSVTNGGGTIDNTGIFYAGEETGNFLNSVKAVSDGVGSVASVVIIAGAGHGQGAGSGSGQGASPSASPTPQMVLPVINEVIVDPDFVKAMKGATIPITAKAIDQFGNPMPTGGANGVNYNFEISGDLGTLSQQTGGTVLLTASETGIGTVTIRATQGKITKIAKIVGSVGTGMNKRLVIEPISSPQEVGKPFMISIAAKDSMNNLITDYQGPIALADTTGTIDPAVASPSATGVWYVQAIIGLAHDQVTVTAAGDGMIGVSNIFEVTGDPNKKDIGLMMNMEGGGGVKGASISAQIQEFLRKAGIGSGGTGGIKFVGAGLAAGFGVLGASVGGGIMASRGLEAIGRNPFAKKRLQFNLYGSLVAFVAAAALALAAAYLILK